MMLEEIFEHGHRVGLARNPARRVVRLEDPADAAGYYIVKPAALAGLVVKKSVTQNEVLTKVEEPLASASNWVVDHVHCWCPRCAESRRMSQTHCD